VRSEAIPASSIPALTSSSGGERRYQTPSVPPFDVCASASELLELNYEPMELTADAGLTMIIYSAEPGSP